MVSRIFFALNCLKVKTQARGMQKQNKIIQVIIESFMETKKGVQSILNNNCVIIKTFSSQKRLEITFLNLAPFP